MDSDCKKQFILILLLAAIVLASGCIGQSEEFPPEGKNISGAQRPAAEAGDNISHANAASSGIWRPAPGTSFQWQLLDLPVDQTVQADVYDIDLFDNDASIVASLHAKERKVICYINVGAWENWRPDANDFPSSVIGKDYAGWPGEKWLDIRKIYLIGSIMQKRLDMCKEKGFDAIEPDNIDGYLQDSGFPITYQDQINYNIWLSNEAHKRGLSIALKNDGEQAADLINYFDWALTESCYADQWCQEVAPFVKAGKAVFMTEYTDQGTTTKQFCPTAKELGFYGVLKNRNLDAWREACE